MTEIALAILAGGIIGLSLGLVGAGGSILAVPLLVYLLGEAPHAATTESLVVVGASALSGAASHSRHGNIRWNAIVWFLLAGGPGILLGTQLNEKVSEARLLTMFALVMLVAAASMVHRARQPSASPDAPPRNAKSWPWLAATGFSVGAVTGFFGVGGGFVIVPALVFMVALSARYAIGTSLVIIGVNAIAAFSLQMSQGRDIDLAVTTVFAAGAIVTGLIAGHYSQRLSNTALSHTFATITTALALYMLYDNVSQIT